MGRLGLSSLLMQRQRGYGIINKQYPPTSIPKKSTSHIHILPTPRRSTLHRHIHVPTNLLRPLYPDIRATNGVGVGYPGSRLTTPRYQPQRFQGGKGAEKKGRIIPTARPPPPRQRFPRMTWSDRRLGQNTGTRVEAASIHTRYTWIRR